MISVAAYHSFNVFYVPCIEYQVVIFWFLTNSPGVECFDHNQKSHFVTKIYQFRGRRVVACADGIATHFLQNFKSPGSSTDIECSSEGSQIMMITNTSDFDSPAIE